ncbi:hypothetical protein [Marinoscillum sp. 108]|uniref:hypothetical protein n=1 Tax=Marinoscillum sp. 108 TaxID=2653151 RepID=UPI0012F0770B|nr:hypothetical protein [Marinoscillum sp. 108]VXD11821.1 hypothetical protein MARINOS108_10700 [Marinoscillum sp. 108]
MIIKDSGIRPALRSVRNRNDVRENAVSELLSSIPVCEVRSNTGITSIMGNDQIKQCLREKADFLNPQSAFLLNISDLIEDNVGFI